MATYAQQHPHGQTETEPHGGFGFGSRLSASVGWMASHVKPPLQSPEDQSAAAPFCPVPDLPLPAQILELRSVSVFGFSDPSVAVRVAVLLPAVERSLKQNEKAAMPTTSGAGEEYN